MPEVRCVGSVKDTVISPANSSCDCVLASKCTQSVFTTTEVNMLKKVLAKPYSCSPENVTVCSTFRMYLSCSIKSYSYVLYIT